MTTDLRLLMGPVTNTDHNGSGIGVKIGKQYRWVCADNGHPCGCGEGCWHASPDAALRCFETPKK